MLCANWKISVCDSGFMWQGDKLSKSSELDGFLIKVEDTTYGIWRRESTYDVVISIDTGEFISLESRLTLEQAWMWLIHHVAEYMAL